MLRVILAPCKVGDDTEVGKGHLCAIGFQWGWSGEWYSGIDWWFRWGRTSQSMCAWECLDLRQETLKSGA